MNPDQFLKEAYKITDVYADDPETLHFEHDKLCWRVLSDLGYGAGLHHMQVQTRWYA